MTLMDALSLSMEYKYVNKSAFTDIKIYKNLCLLKVGIKNIHIQEVC